MSLSEILVIIVVALLVFGPNKLPHLAKQAGKFMALVQNLIAKMKSQVDQQLLLAQLEDNQAKAELADQKYAKDDGPSSGA